MAYRDDFHQVPYPTIGKDGLIGEMMVEVHRENYAFQHPIQKVLKPIATYAYGNRPPAVEIKYEVFTPKLFAFSVRPGRILDIIVCISDQFMPLEPESSRLPEAEKLVNKYAAWFGSYGQRRSW